MKNCFFYSSPTVRDPFCDGSRSSRCVCVERCFPLRFFGPQFFSHFLLDRETALLSDYTISCSPFSCAGPFALLLLVF
jgi:hypothetical protein